MHLQKFKGMIKSSPAILLSIALATGLCSAYAFGETGIGDAQGDIDLPTVEDAPAQAAETEADVPEAENAAAPAPETNVADDNADPAEPAEATGTDDAPPSDATETTVDSTESGTPSYKVEFGDTGKTVTVAKGGTVAKGDIPTPSKTVPSYRNGTHICDAAFVGWLPGRMVENQFGYHEAGATAEAPEPGANGEVNWVRFDFKYDFSAETPSYDPTTKNIPQYGIVNSEDVSKLPLFWTSTEATSTKVDYDTHLIAIYAADYSRVNFVPSYPDGIEASDLGMSLMFLDPHNMASQETLIKGQSIHLIEELNEIWHDTGNKGDWVCAGFYSGDPKKGGAKIDFSAAIADRSKIYVNLVLADSSESTSITPSGNAGISIEGNLDGDAFSSGEIVDFSANSLNSGKQYDDLVSAIKDGTQAGFFEVVLNVDDKQIHTGFGSLTLSFPIDAKWNGYWIKVHHRHADGRITFDRVIAKDGKVTIQVTDLSAFALEVEEPSSTNPQAANDPKSDGSAPAASTTNSDSDNGGSDSASKASSTSSDSSSLSQTGDESPAGFLTLIAALAALVLVVLIIGRERTDHTAI